MLPYSSLPKQWASSPSSYTDLDAQPVTHDNNLHNIDIPITYSQLPYPNNSDLKSCWTFDNVYNKTLAA